VVVLTTGLGELDCGEQAGLGFDHNVAFEPVLTRVHGLMDMPRLGVHSGDNPVRGHPPGDTPPPVGAIGVLGRFDILAGSVQPTLR
jgi:hypothetical protein